MRKQLVIANWKCNGSLEANASWMAGFNPLAADLPAETVVCAPFVYIPQLVAGLKVEVGAENVSATDEGAFTGEISAEMLRDIGAAWSIVGHSERRKLYGETNETVALKAARLVEAGLKPVVCVGETLEERKEGRTLEVVLAQLDAVLDKIPAACLGALAYEPVWAIGTGVSAGPDEAQAVHAALRAHVARRDEEAASRLRILYGGSVKPGNARELFKMPDIDGGLIGGAALVASDFINIARAF